MLIGSVFGGLQLLLLLLFLIQTYVSSDSHNKIIFHFSSPKDNMSVSVTEKNISISISSLFSMSLIFCVDVKIFFLSIFSKAET